MQQGQVKVSKSALVEQLKTVAEKNRPKLTTTQQKCREAVREYLEACVDVINNGGFPSIEPLAFIVPPEDHYQQLIGFLELIPETQLALSYDEYRRMLQGNWTPQGWTQQPFQQQREPQQTIPQSSPEFVTA